MGLENHTRTALLLASVVAVAGFTGCPRNGASLRDTSSEETGAPLPGDPVSFTQLVSGEGFPPDPNAACEGLTSSECDGVFLTLVRSQSELEALFAAELPDEEVPAVDFSSSIAVVGYMPAAGSADNELVVDAVHAEGPELFARVTNRKPPYVPDVVTRPYFVITVADAGYTSATGELYFDYDTGYWG